MKLEGIFSAAKDPIEALKSRVEKTSRPLGLCFSSYFPLELFDAFGLEGAWLPNIPRPFYDLAESEVQTFVCNPVRSATEVLLRDELQVSLVATTTGCDARVVMKGILDGQISAKVIPLPLPVFMGSRYALSQTVEALRSFCNEARDCLGREMDHEALRRSIRLRQEVRSRIMGLFDDLGTRVKASFAYSFALASQVLQPEEVIEALDHAERVGAIPPPEEGVSVMLSGSSIPSLALIEALEDLGFRVVADDTCTGTRGASRILRQDISDPIEGIAHSLVYGRFHGPVIVEAHPSRLERILSVARLRKAALVIFLTFKFCDPHAFEVPRLTRALEGASIRTITVEFDRDATLTERDRTRLQALLEELSASGVRKS